MCNIAIFSFFVTGKGGTSLCSCFFGLTVPERFAPSEVEVSRGVSGASLVQVWDILAFAFNPYIIYRV